MTWPTLVLDAGGGPARRTASLTTIGCGIWRESGGSGSGVNNMADYISREAALTEFQKVCDVCMALTCEPVCGECSIADTVRKVKRIPAADVAEVRHGEWVHHNMGGWKCSECNNQAPFYCMASTQNLSDYCYNCGARMKEGADNA